MGNGFYTASDVPSTTIDGQDINDIWAEFQATINLRNAERLALASLFTFKTAESSDMVAQSGDVGEFEEASEFGIPKALHSAPETLRMGFPLRWFDRATRYTRDFIREATADQVSSVHAQALEADNKLVFKGVLNALLSKPNGTNEDGQTVFRLWNGDGNVPPTHGGDTFDGGHTHYLTTNSADVDGTDLKDLINHVTHHGYGTEAGDRLIILVNPQEADTVRALRVADVAPFDFISSESAPAYLTQDTLVGQRPPASYEGLTVIGGFGQAWIVEDYLVPKGYVIALSTGGANASRNPLAFREHKRNEYKGLRQIQGPNDAYPLAESYYSRGFGIGARHRGAAAVMQVTVSTTYTPPTL